MPNTNYTKVDGASMTVSFYQTGDSWTLKYVLAKRESDTETNIDFDTLPFPIADVKAFYNDQQVSQELKSTTTAVVARAGWLACILSAARPVARC